MSRLFSRDPSLFPSPLLGQPAPSPPSSSGLTRGSTPRQRPKTHIPHRRISRIKHLTTFSSPPLKPMPTIYPSRFGCTGPHNRRDGTGALMVCRHAGGSSRAAQKMVSLSSSGGACVCRTQPGMAPQRGPYRRRGTGVARKNTPNGARRVSLLKFQFEAHDVSRPILGFDAEDENNQDRQGLTPSGMICLDSDPISCQSAPHEA
jgi:hypothetical protein